MEEKIKLLREKLIKELSKLEDGVHVKLDYDPIIIDSLLFKKEKSYTIYKKFVSDFSIEILKKLDFSNVDFTDFYAASYDFSELYGVRLNPKKVYCKSLRNSILKGVYFTDSFDNCEIDGADFTGSINAKLNPNTLYFDRFGTINLRNCKFSDLTFTKPFLGSLTIKFSLSDIDFTGSHNAVIYTHSLDCFGLSYCKLNGVTLIGNVKCFIKGTDFTGAISKTLGFTTKVKIDPQKVYNKNFTDTKLNGVVITNSFEGAVINNTDFTGCENAYIDLRKIHNASDYKTCNFTGVKVINMDGKELSVSSDGRVSNYLEDKLDLILGIEKESEVLSKEKLELARKELIELNRKKVEEKINELLKLVETSENLGVDPKHLYCSIPISRDELLVNIDDHYEINLNFIKHLRFLNLSLIDFTNVKVSGIDFRGSAARINPQTVYNKDLSNGVFDSSNIKFFDDLTGVNIEGADFTECEIDIKEKLKEKRC